MWVKLMKWDTDLAEMYLCPRRGLLQLAMYAAHLGSGSTLMCRTIRSDTVKRYVFEAASFHALFGPHARDFRKENATDTKVSKTLSDVFDELKRWEDVPNRREPFTLEMLDEMKREFVNCGLGSNTLSAALLDWFECGLFGGFRLSEWAQEATKSEMNSYQLNKRHEAQALCMCDVRFESAERGQYSAAAAAAATDTTMVKCWIKFRTQKNGQNGEEKLFVRNTAGKCFPSAMLRIIRRFVHLRGASDTHTPLAVYQSATSDKATQFVSAPDIVEAMRRVAARVYNLDPKKDAKHLHKWSAHSLRVGACVILHSLGMSPTQIKFLLRWRSDAFMVYLRNTAILANSQNALFNEADAMPNFL
jgi:hypothetical protein